MKVMLALTSNAILDKVTSYDIFRYYINNFYQIDKFFCSELREDKNPTCVITYRNSELKYKDFRFKGFMNCFSYVQEKYNVNYNQALQIINSDFNLGLISVYGTYKHIKTKDPILYNINLEDYKKSENTIIEVYKRNWNINDKKFWFDKYGITTKELEGADIFPIRGYWLNDIYYGTDPVAYGYYLGKHPEKGYDLWKIYQPYSKLKWLSNCPSNVYQGYSKLPYYGETLVITKSWKDILIFNKLGLNAFAPQSEVSNLDENLIQSLKNRFKNIVIFYDNDETGIRSAIELSTLYDIPYLYLPREQGIKDASDYIYRKSLNELNIFLKSHDISSNNS